LKGRIVVEFDVLDSTNDYAKEVAKEARDGTVIQARRQRKGKGRRDRIWYSEEGGLYLSVILKPEREVKKLLPLTLLTSLAVVETLRDYKIEPKIKWPNDVLVNGKKIAGVLVETACAGERLEYVVVGVGINVNNDLKECPEGVSVKDIKKEEVVLRELRERFLNHFFLFYSEFLEKGFGKMKKRWVEEAQAEGKRLKDRKTGKIFGIFLDIAEDGGIIYKPIEKDVSSLPELTYDTEIDFLK